MMSSRTVSWQAAPRLRRLATVSLIAVAAALLTGRGSLLLLAAPAMAALAIISRRSGPGELEVTAAISASRCFEGEDVELAVTLVSPQILDEIAFSLELPGGVEHVSGSATQVALHDSRAEASWVMRPTAWGRRTAGLVRVRCRYGGGWQADLELRAGTLEVFPQPPAAHARIVPADLLRRIGEHAARVAGDGIEFTGIRDYAFGDRLRDVNWAVTSRRGRLQVNQRAAERAADLVVMIDAFSEIGPPGDSTLDACVHGAAALTAAYLRIGDRVGFVALGGMLRWLSPGAGGRHFYRIIEMVFDVRHESVVTPSLGRIPRTALPPAALVVLFSPLLDERAIGAVTDLRRRGFSLIVVDVLRHEPPVMSRSPGSDLAVRLWRLDRAALRSSLAGLGVPVVTWHSGGQLDAVLDPMRRLPAAARRP